MVDRFGFDSTTRCNPEHPELVRKEASWIDIKQFTRLGRGAATVD
jgi:hypothetical protein